MRYLLFLFIFPILSCQEKSRYPDGYDGSKVPDIKVGRFERALFSVDTSRLEQSIDALKKEFPAISRIFFESVVQWTKNIDSLDAKFYERAQRFYNDPAAYDLFRLVNNKFERFDPLKEQLKEASGLAQYYFPEIKPPNYYTLISGFNVGNFIFEDEGGVDGLGIGLDFFLGPDFDYKSVDPSNPAFSKYISRTFNPDHMAKKTWEVWVEDKIGPEPGDRLLDYIIHRGKRQYLLSRILPQIPDTVLFEFNEVELKWCSENRKAIWSYFTSENLLYENTLSRIQKYINPSPDSPGMPSVAPGQTGTYIGYFIIEAYMNRNPAATLQSLIKETDSQKILDLSKFKPVDE